MNQTKTHLRLENPFTLTGRLNPMLRCYGRYPNGFRKVPKPVAAFNYALTMLGRLWGFYRLKRGRHSYIEARCGENRNFTIRDTNSQFQTVYLDQYEDVYEPDVSAAIELYLPEKGTFIDIGSNWGHHSFAAILNKDASVVAFEPSPVIFQDIRRIAAELGVEEKITVRQAALSDQEGELELRQHYFETCVGSISNTFAEARASERYISLMHRLLCFTPIVNKVKVSTLDSFNLEKADFIKIVAEGLEANIPRGASGTIEKLRPTICFEFHSDDLKEFEHFRTFFSAMDYTINTIRVERSEDDTRLFSVAVSPVERLEANTQYNLIAMPNPS